MKAKLQSILLGMLCGAFYALVLVHALFMADGCAHARTVANACKPAPSDVDTALAALQSSDWQAMLKNIVIAKGLCIARAAVQQVVDALSGSQALAMPDGAPSSEEIVNRGRAWLADNPQ